MRIAVIGAGGVGGYFGAKLAKAGHDVAFVARGEHFEAMRTRGLVVESAGGDIVLPNVSATSDPASLAPVDVAMFCVKLWDVEKAAAQMGPLCAKGGVAYIAASIRAPGVIAHVGSMARLRVDAFTIYAGLSPYVDGARA